MGKENMQVEKRPTVFQGFVKENLSFIYSISCAICFAIHNYISAVSMTKWRNSLVVLFPECFPLILCHLVYHAYRAKTVVQPQTGKLWSRDHSVFFKNGTFNRLAVVVLLIRALAADIIPINIAMVSYFSRKVEMSPAVV